MELKAPSVLALARDAAFVVGVYLFFCGSTYQYAYFVQLGVPADPADFNFSSVATYAYTVVGDSVWQFVLAAVIIALFAWGCSIAMQRYPGRAFAIKITAVVTVAVIMFPFIYYFAQVSALNRVNEIRNNAAHLHFVRAILSAGESRALRKEHSQFLDLNDAEVLQLVAQSAQSIYFFYAPPSNDPKIFEAGKIFALPRDKVLQMEIRIDERAR